MKQFIAVAILIFGFQAVAQDIETDKSLDAEIDQTEETAPVKTEAVKTETTETKTVETKTVASKPKKKKTASKEEKADVTKDDSGDTYNFYFQKGSGPGSVEQGSGQQKVGPAGGTSTAKPVEEEEEVSRFEGHLGLVAIPTNNGTGLSVGGQVNFSPAWGMQIELMSLQGSSDGTKTSKFSINGSEDKETKTSATGAVAAVVYSPFTIHSRRMPMRFGFLGGIMTYSVKTEETVHTFGSEGSNDSASGSTEHKTLPFAGVTASIKLGKQFGVTGAARFAMDTDYSQIGIGAAYFF